jgi:hypothetical protein
LENKDVLLQFVLRRMETNPWVDRAIIGAALTFVIVVVAGYTHDIGPFKNRSVTLPACVETQLGEP